MTDGCQLLRHFKEAFSPLSSHTWPVDRTANPSEKIYSKGIS